MTNQQYAGLVFLIILAGGGYFAGPPLLSAGTTILIVAVVAVILLVLFACVGGSAVDMHLSKRRFERSSERFWDRKNKGLCMGPLFGLPECNNKGVTFLSPACEEFCPFCAQKYNAMKAEWAE
jgi:hypothetical protein